MRLAELRKIILKRQYIDKEVVKINLHTYLTDTHEVYRK